MVSPTTSLSGGSADLVLVLHPCRSYLYAGTKFCDLELVSKCSGPRFSSIKWGKVGWMLHSLFLSKMQEEMPHTPTLTQWGETGRETSSLVVPSILQCWSQGCRSLCCLSSWIGKSAIWNARLWEMPLLIPTGRTLIWDPIFLIHSHLCTFHNLGMAFEGRRVWVGCSFQIWPLLGERLWVCLSMWVSEWALNFILANNTNPMLVCFTDLPQLLKMPPMNLVATQGPAIKIKPTLN